MGHRSIEKLVLKLAKKVAVYCRAENKIRITRFQLDQKKIKLPRLWASRVTGKCRPPYGPFINLFASSLWEEAKRSEATRVIGFYFNRFWQLKSKPIRHRASSSTDYLLIGGKRPNTWWGAAAPSPAPVGSRLFVDLNQIDIAKWGGIAGSGNARLDLAKARYFRVRKIVLKHDPTDSG